MVARRQSAGQTELSLAGRADEAPVATVEDVQRVAGVLEAHGQSTAAEICQHLGWEPSENNKRKVRAVAEASRPGIVSFPNSAGYKLLRQCTLDELRACVAAWAKIRQSAAQNEALYLKAIHSLGQTP